MSASRCCHQRCKAFLRLPAKETIYCLTSCFSASSKASSDVALLPTKAVLLRHSWPIRPTSTCCIRDFYVVKNRNVYTDRFPCKQFYVHRGSIFHMDKLYDICLSMLPMFVARYYYVAALSYVMYFRFCGGWRHFYRRPNGPTLRVIWRVPLAVSTWVPCCSSSCCCCWSPSSSTMTLHCY